MDDDAALLQLAKVLQAVIGLQANEVSSSNTFAEVLDSHMPGLNQEFQAARNARKNANVSQDAEAIRTLRQQIDTIVQRLSRPQG